MGFCSAPGEGDMEDDGVDVVAAAMWDDFLAAKLLFCLSRPETAVPASPPLPLLRLPPGLTWQRKGSRSRTITREGIQAAEKEAATRASPTTPLAWSGDGSGTSGSVCGGGAASRRRKRAREDEDAESKKGAPEAAPGKKRIRAAPSKSSKPEPPQDGEPTPTALGSSSISESKKAVAVAADVVGEPAPSIPVACVEPLRWRSAAEGAGGPVVVGRPGKKTTLAELQAMRESLLQEQAGLRKELERQKVVYDALLQENMRLKKSESSLALHTESRPTSAHVPCEEAMLGQPQNVESTTEPRAVNSPCPGSAAPEQKGGGGEGEEGERKLAGELRCPPAQRPVFLFDLNCTPDEEDL